MRIGPPPLTPLFPLQPDREEKYPAALGQAFVGKPYLTLPEVKAGGLEAKEGDGFARKAEKAEGGSNRGVLDKPEEGRRVLLGPKPAPGPLGVAALVGKAPKGGKVIGGFLDITA